ncbi:hypothetical protein WDZ16_13070 [Pseudokineococcus marinus]|uniref:Uncharacterized protein n=1 Tax=Pseudokineococcus marinus TaxID=351215 RepID=A0A849BKP8_9ACTN|nr:hypothetical protein [Pseudokineococcus marinus]NNH21667.1 hypothetical protein [Pseudokineococcus marinus]
MTGQAGHPLAVTGADEWRDGVDERWLDHAAPSPVVRALELLNGMSRRHMSAANRLAVKDARRALRQAVADGGDPAPDAPPVPRNGGPGRPLSTVEQRVLDVLRGDREQADELVALLGEEGALAVALEHAAEQTDDEPPPTEPPC